MANEILWALVNTLVRIIAIILIDRFLGRLLYTTSSRFISRGLIALTILYGLAVVLDVFLICRPMAAARDNSVDGRCGNQIASYVALESIGALIDIPILATPPPMICMLPIAWQKKLCYSSQLSVGGMYAFPANPDQY